MGLLCIPVVVAAAVALGGAGEAATSQERAAREDIERRLDAFPPPPEAERVDQLAELDGPASEVASPNFLDVGRAWVTPEPVARVRRWVEAHAPSNEGSIGGGFTSSPERAVWHYDYFLPERKGVARERSLLVSVTAHGRGSALRADAQAVWIEPRPLAAAIPMSANRLEVTRTKEGHPREVALVRGAPVRRLAALINRLEIVQPGLTSCLQTGPQAEISLRFRRDDRALARARFRWPASNCDFVALTIGGERQPGLEEVWLLQDALRPILGGLVNEKPSATESRRATRPPA